MAAAVLILLVAAVLVLLVTAVLVLLAAAVLVVAAATVMATQARGNEVMEVGRRRVKVASSGHTAVNRQ